MKLIFYIGLFVIICILFYFVFSKYSIFIELEGYTSVPTKIGFAYNELTPILQNNLNFPKEHNLTLQAKFIEDFIVPLYEETTISSTNIILAKNVLTNLGNHGLTYENPPENSALYLFMQNIVKTPIVLPPLPSGAPPRKAADVLMLKGIIINAHLMLIEQTGKLDKPHIEQYFSLLDKLKELNMDIFNPQLLPTYLGAAFSAGISVKDKEKMVNFIMRMKDIKISETEIKTCLDVMKPLGFRDLNKDYVDYIDKLSKNQTDYNKISKLVSKEIAIKDFIKSSPEKIKEYISIIIPYVSDEHYKKIMASINLFDSASRPFSIVHQMIESLEKTNRELLDKFDTLNKNDMQKLKENTSAIILLHIFPFTILYHLKNHIQKWNGTDKKTICDSANPLNIRMTNMHAPTSSPSLQDEQHAKYAALCK